MPSNFFVYELIEEAHILLIEVTIIFKLLKNNIKIIFLI